MNKILFEPEGHIYTTPEGLVVPSVSEILEHFGISDFSRVNGRVLEAAQNFGSVVHKTCELYDKDDLAECDPQIQPYLDQWNNFKGDELFSSFEIIETPLYSKMWCFAGTPDRINYGNKGFNVLLDIKTGSEYPAHRVQTAFYQILVEENYKIKIKNRVCVYLGPDKYHAVEHKDKSDINIAKSLISIYNFKKREGLL